MFPARSAGELRGNVGLRVAVVELRVRSWFDAPGNRWPSSAGQATRRPHGKGLYADGDYLPLRGKVTRVSDDGVKITPQLKAIGYPITIRSNAVDRVERARPTGGR